MSDYEEPSELFEKPRGERRWLGREHHRGKERLFESVKDRMFIEKTVSSQLPMSKKAVSRINDSTKDELELNVVYSLDKKNRWRDADTITLLGSAPAGVNAEVVQKNGLEQFGFLYPNKSTFSVTSKVVSEQDAPGEFGIRSATSSGKGQDYSNFVAKSRELSKKANARVKIEEEEEESAEQQPTVSYNIYKTHRSVDAVGGQMFKAKVVSKSGKHRANKKIDMEVYDDEDFEDEEEEEVEELSERTDKMMDLTDYVLEPRDKQAHKRAGNRKDSEMSYVFVDHEALVPEPGYTDLLDIQSFLRDEGFTFAEAEVTFHNQKDNMHHQMSQLQYEKGMKVINLRANQCLVNVSEQCQLDGASSDGEVTTVIVLTHLKKNQYHVLVNSTLPSHPSKRGAEYLRKQISSAQSLKEAISRITTEMITSRVITETMKLSSSFYAEKSFSQMIHESSEWESQLINMDWPNRHYHSTWANSKELSTVGTVLEWKDLCEMIKEPRPSRTCTPFQGDACGVCSRQKMLHELFVTTDETKVKCTECLRDEFYRELRARRVPIDLKTDCADELEYLPTFIPLTIVNLYVRMVAEQIYSSAGAVGSFEKCPSCKSALYFEVGTGKSPQNRSCPCGYSWCRHCDRVPHWPLECGDYAEWEEKWLLRYAMMHAQGTGTETLLQVTCPCKKQIYNALLPEQFLECPRSTCKITVNMHTMNTVHRHYYYPYPPRFRKQVEQGYYKIGDYYDQCKYVPEAMIYTKITKIPGIRTSVMETCGAARDVRFDEATRNQAVKREHVLLRKSLLDGVESVENAMGTVVYLTEMMTAWMHVTNQYDRNIKISLETMMENRKVLVEMLEKEDSEGVKETLRKIRKGIDSVVQAVEKKM